MMVVVTGASGSGKSEYAEGVAVHYCNDNGSD